VPPLAVTEVSIENADLAIYGHVLEYQVVLSTLAYHSEFKGGWRTSCLEPVDLGDFAVVAGDWLVAALGLPGDINRGEITGMFDLVQLAQHWLEDCGAL
jgi:hypothetical protein